VGGGRKEGLTTERGASFIGFMLPVFALGVGAGEGLNCSFSL